MHATAWEWDCGGGNRVGGDETRADGFVGYGGCRWVWEEGT